MLTHATQSLSRNTSTGNVGTLDHYIHWECWNPRPLHPLGVLESWTITSTRTLDHYIHGECWNPRPLHPLGMLEPRTITSTGNVGTPDHYIHWECWNSGPHWECWNPGPHWECWNPGPLHPLRMLEPRTITSTGNIGTPDHYIH